MLGAIRGYFGYLFLIFVVRIVGRRPGKQLTPFEFVLIFFIGGLALTAIVGDDASLTNAFCSIVAIGMAHFTLVWLRTLSPKIARIFDGTPLLLLEEGQWHRETMAKMRIYDDDVMAMARDKGTKSPEEIDMAVLERNGEISIVPKEE